jgi:hypothetical protein
MLLLLQLIIIFIYIAVRPYKRIKRTLTHRAFDPLARLHSNICKNSNTAKKYLLQKVAKKL